MKKNLTRIKKCCIFAALINKNSSYMETKKSNKLEITIVSLFKMDKLAIGDIFLFSTDGPKFVFLGRTPDNNFYYMRTDTKRRYSCRRNRQVFNMDADGGLFIANGELFMDFQSAMLCATRL